jgi:hypothetical protein
MACPFTPICMHLAIARRSWVAGRFWQVRFHLSRDLSTRQYGLPRTATLRIELKTREALGERPERGKQLQGAHCPPEDRRVLGEIHDAQPLCPGCKSHQVAGTRSQEQMWVASRSRGRACFPLIQVSRPAKQLTLVSNGSARRLSPPSRRGALTKTTCQRVVELLNSIIGSAPTGAICRSGMSGERVTSASK